MRPVHKQGEPVDGSQTNGTRVVWASTLLVTCECQIIRIPPGTRDKDAKGSLWPYYVPTKLSDETYKGPLSEWPLVPFLTWSRISPG